uniref:Serine palmitoyltransferase 1 n=1 Tax=Phallusia mammillata TaxID=59560 RepID=A0A6F9DSX2_9ASCI|nr:serine palmitoyltransferase 1 [Phallusia mammillata]
MDTEKPWVVAEAIHSALHAPLYHLIVEGVLVILIIRLVFSKSYKIQDKAPLSEEEKDELVSEWQPEPLVPPMQETTKSSRVVSGPIGKSLVVNGMTCNNFASMNFLGLNGHARIQEQAQNCIEKYGVGACGPRGFYGTFDVHLELENRLAAYIGVGEAIMYSYGFSTVASAIPAYAKRGDIIFVDEAVCFAIQKGLQASRSKIVFFKHNDMQDLEVKMQKQAERDKLDPKKAKVVRKFMIVEGIYFNTGQLCDLPKLVELKYKYKVRLFVDESLSFGVLGEHGKGVAEHFNIPVSKIDLISSSLEYSLASVGGFTCGSDHVVNHQRLTGQGYVFSASLPPLLARAAIESLNMMQEDPGMFERLRYKASKMQSLLGRIPGIEITGYHESPSFHIRRATPVSPKKDMEFLNNVVDECGKNGVCIVVASRLKSDEIKQDWPPSIRIAVTVEMTDSDIETAAEVIKEAVRVALEN